MNYIDLTLQEGGSGVSDYDLLSNQPQINGITLTGNKTSEDLNIYLPDGYTITVATDDSGDFTSIQDALNSLNGKICAGTVTIDVKAGTYNISSQLVITNNNIPCLNIVGADYTTTILNFSNISAWTGAIQFNNSRSNTVLDKITIQNAGSTADNSQGVRLDNSYCKFGVIDLKNWSIGADATNGSELIIGDSNGNLYSENCTKCLQCESAGSIKSAFSVRFTFSNATTALNVATGGMIILSTTKKTFANVTNETSQTMNTIASTGYIMGYWGAN